MLRKRFEKSLAVLIICLPLAACGQPFKYFETSDVAPSGPAGAVAGYIPKVTCRNLVADPPTTTRELAKSENVACEMLDNGKKYYRLGQYGLAERSYRQAIETSTGTGMALNKTAQMEMWLGLAATYDQLKRFDLADKAYQHFKMYFGETTAYQNNYGYSLMLRGDTRASSSLLKKVDEKFNDDSFLMDGK